MKKILLSVLALVLFTALSQAQGFRIGIKGGANLDKISGQSFNQGFDLSYHLGGFAEIDFTKKWGIQPEVLFNQSSSQSSSFQTIYTNINTQQQIKLNYLSIPILLRYTIIGGLVTLNAGPQYSILLNQDKSLFQNGQTAFKSGDFSVVAGAQLNLGVLRVYGRYNIGLQNINDIDNKDKWTSQQIQMGIGLRL